jgi:4-diphosphocytidyl-2-C-methyl-D-erythritol kinase
MPVTVRVPAKINLHLGVGSLRADGFHQLATVFQAVSLYDEVTIAPARQFGIEIVGDSEGVPADEHNLAAKAVFAIAARVGRPPNVAVTVRKSIPVAGGMAGGSADAAAALVACDSLWETGIGPEALHELATELGSDVPFCLHGGTALATGRGERLTQVLAKGVYHWVFAIAEAGLSTPSVFAELDRIRGSSLVLEPQVPADLMTALRAGEPRRLSGLLYNDLQAAALHLRPALRRTIEAGRDGHALGAVVCGSGPTVAMLAAGEAEAVALVAALSGSGTCRAVRRAHGPVAGARVVS